MSNSDHIGTKTIADPTSHYGDAKKATRDFALQRLSGGINLVSLIFFAWLVVRIAGTERAEMLAVVGHPLVALLLALGVIVACVHARIGMQEIIEDYVHDARLNSLSLTLNSFVCLAVAAVAVGSLVKLVFWG